MKADPRHRNEVSHDLHITTFIADYATRLQTALLGVDPAALAEASSLIEEAGRSNRRIYAIGNGGSAAIADHLCCDLTKGTHVPGQPVIESISMVSNIALYSAIANDFGFDKVFSSQVEYFGRKDDVLVAISSSGNSSNILDAVTTAHSLGMSTIGLSGFDGGALRTTAQVVLHVNANNYGIVEDAHQALMHVLAQHIAAKRDSSSRCIHQVA